MLETADNTPNAEGFRGHELGEAGLREMAQVHGLERWRVRPRGPAEARAQVRRKWHERRVEQR